LIVDFDLRNSSSHIFLFSIRPDAKQFTGSAAILGMSLIAANALINRYAPLKSLTTEEAVSSLCTPQL
jgi:hypothetical protein